MNTIADIVDQYLILRGVDKKKYFPRYMVAAKWAWQEVFQKGMWVVNSEWKTLQKDEPYNSIQLPSNTQRIFNVSLTDHCGNIVPIYYNNQLNVIPRPSVKSCGCGQCDCDGCNEINSMSVTTKLLFSSGGVDYYEKTWVEVCKNGDILEWKEVPTKKYNDRTGDGADYNPDYNNDYIPPFSNFEIVTQKFQKVICKLKVRPCGCPEKTEENEQILQEHCGCFMQLTSRRRKHCQRVLGDINSNCNGEVKISECGTKIYYKPHPHSNKPIPEFLLVNYQTNGHDCTSAVIVPDYATNALFAGIDCYYKMYNTTFSPNEKREAKYKFNDEQTEIIRFLNPLSLQFLSNIQDAPIVW